MLAIIPAHAGSNIDFGILPGTPDEAGYIAWLVGELPPTQVISEDSMNPGNGTNNGYVQNQWFLKPEQFNNPEETDGSTISIIFAGKGSSSGQAWSHTIASWTTAEPVTDHGEVGGSLANGVCPSIESAIVNSATSEGQVTWTHSGSDDTSNYLVYRSLNASGAGNDASSGIYDLAGSATGTTFTDATILEGATDIDVWYIVVPSDSDSNPNGCASEELKATEGVFTTDPPTDNNPGDNNNTGGDFNIYLPVVTR